MFQLRPYQDSAVKASVEYLRKPQKSNGVTILPTGCHQKDTLILMYNGELKPVQDIIVGDLIMGVDSSPRTVLNLCRGREMMYKITPHRGAEPFIVNAGHILHLKCTNEGKNKKYPSYKNGSETDDISVKDYLLKSKSWKHLRKLIRSSGVDFNSNHDLPIAPHFLGVILGDGSTSKNGISITTSDIEIIDEVRKYADDNNMSTRDHKKIDNAAVSIYLTKKDNKYNRTYKNELIEKLKDLGLIGKTAEHKFVPDIYKTSTRESRIEILSGLLDTDGYHDGIGGYDWISKSEQLAKDLCFIARSLGITVKLSKSIKGCQNNFIGTYYRVSLSGNTSILTCRVRRNKPVIRKQKKNPLVSGFAVEEIGENNYYGFTLDGDHLYHTDDFVIHHNSGKSIVIAEIIKELGEPTLILQPSKEILEQNFAKYHAYGFYATMFSASVGEKIVSSTTFATIGSVISKTSLFTGFKYLIIDECHLVSSKGGMYLDFIRSIPGIRVLGLTATPYRMASNSFGTELRFLTRTIPRVFDKVVYYVQSGDLFKAGYLAKLEYYSIEGFERNKIRVNSTGADFSEQAMKRYYKSIDFDRKLIRVVERLIERGRKSILVFTRGVEEGHELAKAVGGVMITGETPKKERERILSDFKSGRIRTLINCGVLTTGFDYPELDTVVMARPTMSLSLWYQIVGRGTRIHPHKLSCWVVDMCGNLKIFGKVEDLRIGLDNKGKYVITGSGGKQLTNKYFGEINHEQTTS